MTVIPLSSGIAGSCSQRSPLCRVGQGQLFGERALRNTEYALWRGISFLVVAMILSTFRVIFEVESEVKVSLLRVEGKGCLKSKAPWGQASLNPVHCRYS